MLLGHFDEIAQHPVMLDLEHRHIGALTILAFQSGDDPAGFMRQAAQLIQRRMHMAFDEAAIAGEIRRLLHQQQFQSGPTAAKPRR